MRHSLTAFAIAIFSRVSVKGQERSPVNFNSGWRLVVGDPAFASKPDYDDSAWKPITLPHAWKA